VGVDHGVFRDVGADVYKHGGHADYAAGEVAGVADAGAAGDDADTVGGGELARGVGGFVEVRLPRGIYRHVGDVAHAETEEDAFFYPRFRAPTAGGLGVGVGGADFAAVQGLLEFLEEREMLFGVS